MPPTISPSFHLPLPFFPQFFSCPLLFCLTLFYLIVSSPLALIWPSLTTFLSLTFFLHLSLFSSLQTLRQYLLEQTEITEDIISLGNLPVPGEDGMEASSATTFDGAYVVKHVVHPTNGMICSRLKNKVNSVSMSERKHNSLVRKREALEMTKGLVFGNTVEKCTCINSRGQLVKKGNDVPCDHPSCMAPYLISYSVIGRKYESHALASHDYSQGRVARSAASNESSLPALGEHSWEGYSDVSPVLMQMLKDSWRD